ncbi:hypothetical protein KJ840_03585 [Patescibacteria group bacterium]|nr:hypothetical protein [Patescibacteria group bacterium]
MKDYKKFAVWVSKQAGKALMSHYGKTQKLQYKIKTNFTTKLDKQNDVFIRKEIIKYFPDHNIYSEEGKDLF